jgi:hypothetical protein
LLAHDKEIIVAVWSIRAACAAPEKNDGAGVEAFDETVYRFREVGIFYRSLLHRVYISAPRAKSNEDTGKEGSMVGPGGPPPKSNVSDLACPTTPNGALAAKELFGELSNRIGPSAPCPFVFTLLHYLAKSAFRPQSYLESIRPRGWAAA